MNGLSARGMRGTTSFGAPKYRAPKWQTSRISALRRQFAAPQVGRLKRKLTGMTAGMGYDPQSVQARRSTIRGYGEGLGGIMAGAGQLALGQYGQEHAAEVGAAESEYGAAWKGYGERVRLAKEKAGLFKPSERKQLKPWEKREQQEFEREEGEWAVSRERTRGRKLRDWQKYIGGMRRAGRKKGGPVHASVQVPIYEVGEGGTPSKPKPELVVYKGGRMELVGKKGPEIRTFSEDGQVIPAGKTKKILKNKGFSIIPRKRGGRITGYERRLQKEARVKRLKEKIAGAPLQQNIMNYLTATRFDPSGAGHMPYWQFMLQRQPQKLTGLLSYMKDKKFSLGGAPFDPVTKPSGPRAPTKYPGGGTAKPSLEYKRSLMRRR